MTRREHGLYSAQPCVPMCTGSGPTSVERTMANNLFVSFDVHDAAREAPLILSAIEELGQDDSPMLNVAARPAACGTSCSLRIGCW